MGTLIRNSQGHVAALRTSAAMLGPAADDIESTSAL